MASNYVYVISDDNGPIGVFIKKENALAGIQEILNNIGVKYEQIDTYNWKYGEKLQYEIWMDKMVIQDLVTLNKKHKIGY